MAGVPVPSYAAEILLLYEKYWKQLTSKELRIRWPTGTFEQMKIWSAITQL